MPADLRIVAIAAGIVGRRMIGQPVGYRFDQRRAFAAARRGERIADRMTDRDDIVAVDAPHLACRRKPAFSASVAAAVCLATGTEIAQPLLLMTNTTGALQAPAMFRASATSPFEVAPSPKTQTAARF